MQHKHVFIAGLHRSGTSLLHQMICEYEQVSGFADTGVPEDEGQHLQDVFPAANEFGGAGEFSFHPECYMDENHPLVSKKTYDILMEQWGNHWDMSCPILAEKSPPTMIRSRFFQALFPESYFILIRRHPIAVSMATSKWNDAPLPELLAHWVNAQQLMEGDVGRLRHVLELTYEDLTQEPEETMVKVEAFLGLPHRKQGKEIKTGINDKYISAWNEKAPEISDDIVKQCKRFGYDI